jgi:hypothetical protein
MTGCLADSAAWPALLPEGTVWPPGRRPWSARRRRSLLARSAGSPVAVEASAWSLPDVGGPTTAGTGPGSWRFFVAVPSRGEAVLVASRDPAVLRYAAASLVSVPPGTGPLATLILTIGLRLLRFPVVWNVAALGRVARVVAVGRAR